MRGALPFLISVIIAVVVVAVVLVAFVPTISGTAAKPPTAEELEIKPPLSYANVLLDGNGIPNDQYSSIEGYLSSDTFCTRLKNCIKNVARTHRPCEVDTVTYQGNDIGDLLMFHFLPISGKCADELLNYSIAPGVSQKLCKYQKNFAEYGIVVSDSNGLDFATCNYVSNPRTGPGYEQSIDEGFATPAATATYYVSKDHYLTDSSPHPPTDISRDVDGYLGSGKTKIVISIADADSAGNCQFVSRICFQPAIATEEGASTIKIYDVFRTLELGRIRTVPYYLRNGSAEATPVTVDVTTSFDLTWPWDSCSRSGCSCSKNYLITCSCSCNINLRPDLYYWGAWTIRLERDYTPETIVSAIKSGLYDNPFRKGESWWHPHWDVKEDSRACMSSWGGDYKTTLTSGDKASRTRSIYWWCGSDHDCNKDKNLTINTAMRRDYVYETYDASDRDKTCLELGLKQCTSDWKAVKKCCNSGDACIGATKNPGTCEHSEPGFISGIVAVCEE